MEIVVAIHKGLCREGSTNQNMTEVGSGHQHRNRSTGIGRLFKYRRNEVKSRNHKSEGKPS